MVVLGFILIVAAVGLGLGVAVSSGHAANLEVFGTGVETTAAGVFFAGAAAGIAALAGLWLMKKGTARTYRRRKEVKELRHQVEATPAPVRTDAARLEPTDTAPVETAPTAEEAPSTTSSTDGTPSTDDEGRKPATTR